MQIKDFEIRIRSFFLKYLSLEIFYSGGYIFFLLCAWFTGFSLADNLLNFNVFFRWINLFSLFLLFYKIIRKHFRKLQTLSPSGVLLEIEDKYHFKDTLISGYELKDTDNYPSFYIENLLKTASDNLKKVNFNSIIDKIKLKKHIFLSGTGFLVLILYMILLPANFAISFNRFINPEYKIKYSHTIIKTDLSPKNIKVLEGENVSFTLLTYGKVKNAFLVLESRNKEIIRESFPVQKTTNIGTNTCTLYRYTLKSIFDDFKYYAVTVQTRDNIEIKTPVYVLDAVKRPLVQNLTITCIYPAYTRLKAKTVKDNGNIEAVEKTLVRISGEVNNNLHQGTLVYNDRKINLSISDNKFYGSFYLYQSGKYHILLRDENNYENSDPVKYSVIVTPDNPPVVDIIKPGIDINVENEMQVPLVIFAQDDYAVNSLKLFYKVIKAFSSQDAHTENITFNIPKEQSLNYAYTWDLENLSFMPGDIIEYYAQAHDGYQPPDSHTVNSKVYRIQFPTMEDMYRAMNHDEQENVNTVDKLLKDQKELFKETDKILEAVNDKKELSYIEKKQIEQLKENQEKINNAVSDINQKISESIEQIQKKNMYNRNIVQKMEEIQNLLKDVMDKQMKESMEKLNQALNEMKLSESKKQLLSQKITQEEILKRLEKSLEMLKTLKAQKEMEGYKKITEELIKKQNELMAKTLDKKSDKKDANTEEQLKQQQEAIQNNYNEMKKSLEEFQKQLKDNKNMYENEVAQLNQKMEQSGIKEDFQDSKNSLNRKQLSSSVESQKKIVSKLNKIKNSMEKAQSRQQQVDLEKLMLTLDARIFNLLQISRKIELYKSGISQSGSALSAPAQEKEPDDYYPIKAPQDIAEDLIFLERSIQAEKKILEEETKDIMLFQPAFYKKFDEAASALAAVRENSTENRSYGLETYLQTSLLYINIIIKNLIDLKDDIRDQMQNQSSQNMDDALNQMADAQQSLNNSTQRMQGQVGKNGMSQEMQEYLEELAFQQQVIKEGVESMIQNYQDAGKLLGDMGQAAKEMEDIKEKLQSKKLDNNVVEMQKKVLKRLLDSKKSLQVKDTSQERKADQVQSYTAEKPAELQKEKVDYKSKINYNKTVNKYPLEYKSMIDDYFKVLTIIEETEGAKE